MSTRDRLQLKAESFNAKATRLSIVLADCCEPVGLALLVKGDLDTDSSGHFQTFVFEVLAELQPGSTLILDLAALNYLSSTGVGSLTAILSNAKKRKIGLAISSIPKRIWNIIDLLGFTAFFTFIDSYEVRP
jgi:anti-sigma B factor antagonist